MAAAADIIHPAEAATVAAPHTLTTEGSHRSTANRASIPALLLPNPAMPRNSGNTTRRRRTRRTPRHRPLRHSCRHYRLKTITQTTRHRSINSSHTVSSRRTSSPSNNKHLTAISTALNRIPAAIPRSSGLALLNPLILVAMDVAEARTTRGNGEAVDRR